MKDWAIVFLILVNLEYLVLISLKKATTVKIQLLVASTSPTLTEPLFWGKPKLLNMLEILIIAKRSTLIVVTASLRITKEVSNLVWTLLRQNVLALQTFQTMTINKMLSLILIQDQLGFSLSKRLTQTRRRRERIPIRWRWHLFISMKWMTVIQNRSLRIFLRTKLMFLITSLSMLKTSARRNRKLNNNNTMITTTNLKSQSSREKNRCRNITTRLLLLVVLVT